jgi:hypothetical protein
MGSDLLSKGWLPSARAGRRTVARGRPAAGYDYDTFAADPDKLLTALDLREADIACSVRASFTWAGADGLIGPGSDEPGAHASGRGPPRFQVGVPGLAMGKAFSSARWGGRLRVTTLSCSRGSVRATTATTITSLRLTGRCGMPGGM